MLQLPGQRQKKYMVSRPGALEPGDVGLSIDSDELISGNGLGLLD